MIGDYRIYCDMDAMDTMDCLSDSQEVDFMYECYKRLSPLKQGDFFRKAWRGRCCKPSRRCRYC